MSSLTRLVNMGADYGAPMIGAEEVIQARDFGYQLGADNDEEAMEVGAEYIGAFRRLRHNGAAAQHARQHLQRRRQQCRCAVPGGQGPYMRPPFPLPPARRGRLGGDDEDLELGGDTLDEVDDAELGAIDSEIEGLGADDEDLGGDSQEALGATVAHLNNKLDRLHRLRDRIEAKLANTPERKFRKRQRLQKHLVRINKHIEIKEAKLKAKKEKALIKAGIPPAQAAAIAAGGAAAGALLASTGVDRQQLRRAEEAVMQNQASAAQGIFGMYGPLHTAGSGTIVNIPFLDGLGAADPLFTKPAGGAGGTSLILSTDAFSYADFIPLGIDVAVLVQGGDASDMLPSILINNWQINGGLDQVYGDQSLRAAGGITATAKGAGIISYGSFLPAMRQARVQLNRTNTAEMTMTIGNKLSNAGPIYFKIEASLRVQVFKDDNVPG